MRILEATIAIMIVSGVMIVSYSGQVQREASVAEYSESLQGEILADIVMREDLRLNVLNVENDNLLDANYVLVNDFVGSKIPPSFGYLLRICNLSSEDDFCKMDSMSYIATVDKDVFVEDVIISAEVGPGGGSEVFAPKKVRIFLWEE